MKNNHVLAIPYPAQGHVIPLMETSRWLANNGLKITFVNTETIHKKITSAMSAKDDPNDMMKMVWISDGLELWEDRSDLGKLTEAIFTVMPRKLEELIQGINETNDDKVTCVVADVYMGWAVKVAQKMGLKNAVFDPSSATTLATIMSIPKLLENEVIDSNGEPLKDEMIQLSTTMPSIDPTHLLWTSIGDKAMNKILFHTSFLGATEAANTADRIICNSTTELENGAFTLFPKMLPIGPLLATNRLSKQTGHLWNEDSTCLTWLDHQPIGSVIYVAFGSFTIFNQIQFDELALGLELTNKPFLWAVRPGVSGGSESVYPDGYMERLGYRGKMVSWAPQQEVLNHPSVACFMSHCGWNSTMEGVSNGVPFLCWPYFGDQFLNTTYICDMWKIGMGLKKDDTGIVTREEIKIKVEELFNSKVIKENALNLKEKVADSLRPGKSSSKNLDDFIDWVKK